MTARQRLWVEDGAARIAVARWGDGDRHKPAALLVHGTGFVAEVWEDVAQALASRYEVYALDRRGHGASHKPSAGGIGQYHFLDFARDLCRVVEALELSDILGVGHSAGATDLLLAAARLPARFTRIFAMEPTVMDPSAPRPDGAALGEALEASRQRVRRRRSEFASRSQAIERFRRAPAFAHVRCASRQPSDRRRSTRRWLPSPSRRFRERAAGALQESGTASRRKRPRC